MRCTDIDILEELGQNAVDWLLLMLLTLSEQKTGKWVEISPAEIYERTKCGQNVMTGDIDVYNYCPQCGAKMIKYTGMEVVHETD